MYGEDACQCLSFTPFAPISGLVEKHFPNVIWNTHIRPIFSPYSPQTLTIHLLYKRPVSPTNLPTTNSLPSPRLLLYSIPQSPFRIHHTQTSTAYSKSSKSKDALSTIRGITQTFNKAAQPPWPMCTSRRNPSTDFRDTGDSRRPEHFHSQQDSQFPLHPLHLHRCCRPRTLRNKTILSLRNALARRLPYQIHSQALSARHMRTNQNVSRYFRSQSTQDPV